ncbi:MAG: cupin domain-containing protein [Gaiellaceae bacterium]
MSAFSDLSAMPPTDIWEAVAVRAVHGERLTLGVVELAANALVPEHAHDNEQLGIVLTGSVTFRVGDESRELGPGGMWTIPPNVPHDVQVGPEGAVVIDAFAPGRADWAERDPSAERQPRWP